MRAGHRVLLFSQMTRALDVIQDYLDMRAIPHLRLDGTTKTDDRCRIHPGCRPEQMAWCSFTS